MDGTHTGKLSAESVRGRKAECAVQRSILSPGTAKLRRVQRTKQPKRSRGSGLPFASPLRRAQQKQGTATTRGKEFLSRVCGQKWVPPGAWRFCDTLKAPGFWPGAFSRCIFQGLCPQSPRSAPFEAMTCLYQ